jgi:hypothetical protein
MNAACGTRLGRPLGAIKIRTVGSDDKSAVKRLRLEEGRSKSAGSHSSVSPQSSFIPSAEPCD